MTPQASPTCVASNGIGSPASPHQPTVNPFLRWALYAWMFSLPYNVIVPTWLPLEFQGVLSIPRMVGVGLTLAFLLDPKLWPWKLPPAFPAFAAFFVIFTGSMLRGNFANFLVVFQQLQLLVLFLICYNIFLTGQATRGALLSFALSCGIASAMMLTGYAEDPFAPAYGRRLTGFGASPNLYSKVLMVGALVAIGMGHVRKEKSLIRLPLLWAIALLTIAAIAHSGSRGMTLALAVGLATFILRKGSFWVRLRNLLLLAVIAGVAFWFLTHTEVLLDRWTRTLQTWDTAGRDEIAREAFGMIKEKPFIGWGPSAEQILARRVHSTSELRATHNMVLTILIFTGLIGSVPYSYAYSVVVWRAWRSRSGVENVLPLALMAGLFMSDMSSGGLPEKIHWTFFAYILATSTLTLSAAQSPKLDAMASTGASIVRQPGPR